jgi:hypothetical protein
MIYRLKLKDSISFYDFVLRCKDSFEDFYITQNKERKFIKDLKLIEKLLRYQEVYALEDKEIKGILLIVKEKGFRPYLKILAIDSKIEWNLLRFFSWNFTQEIYIKLKVKNPLIRSLQKHGFQNKGFRGSEILLYRPKQDKREIKIQEIK